MAVWTFTAITAYLACVLCSETFSKGKFIVLTVWTNKHVAVNQEQEEQPTHLCTNLNLDPLTTTEKTFILDKLQKSIYLLKTQVLYKTSKKCSHLFDAHKPPKAARGNNPGVKGTQRRRALSLLFWDTGSVPSFISVRERLSSILHLFLTLKEDLCK